MVRQQVETISCDKCGKPGETWTVGKGSRKWEVDLCDKHAAPPAELIKIGREVTKLRASERIIPTDRAKLLKSLETG